MSDRVFHSVRAVPEGRKPRFDLDRGCYVLPLTQGRVALLDADDAPVAARRCWSWMKAQGGSNGHAVSMQYGKMLFLARVLAGAGEGDRVAWTDGDTLNLRRSNVAVAGRQTTTPPSRSTGESTAG